MLNGCLSAMAFGSCLALLSILAIVHSSARDRNSDPIKAFLFPAALHAPSSAAPAHPAHTVFASGRSPELVAELHAAAAALAHAGRTVRSRAPLLFYSFATTSDFASGKYTKALRNKLCYLNEHGRVMLLDSVSHAQWLAYAPPAARRDGQGRCVLPS